MCSGDSIERHYPVPKVVRQHRMHRPVLPCGALAAVAPPRTAAQQP